MNVGPILNVPIVERIHAVAALSTLIIGAIQLWGINGAATRRVLGYAWVIVMLSVALLSFWVHEIRQWVAFSLIHLLSIVVLTMVPFAVLAAQRGNRRRHRMR